MKVRHIGAAMATAVAVSLTGPAYGFELIDLDNDVISIELRTGNAIRLDEPAASVFVADPDIADIQPQSQQLFFLFATGLGETTLIAVNEQDEVIASQRVRIINNATTRGLQVVRGSASERWTIDQDGASPAAAADNGSDPVPTD